MTRSEEARRRSHFRNDRWPYRDGRLRLSGALLGVAVGMGMAIGIATAQNPYPGATGG